MLIGLVGKPSCGKSTFFKASTLMDVDIANYPFTTIKPNSGVGYARIECSDKDFDVQCEPNEGYCANHKRFIPVQILDVAGLVPGAHEGKGMGNQFLSDLNQADFLIHIVDVSGKLNVKGEPGEGDPAADIRFLEDELDQWYYQIFEKAWKKFSNRVNQNKENIVKALADQFSGLRVTEPMIKESIASLNLEKPIISWSEDELRKLTRMLRIKSKPMVIAANKIDVPGAYENFKKLKKEFPNTEIIPCSAEAELALKEAANKDLIDYIPGGREFSILETGELSDRQLKALNFINEMLDERTTTGVQEVINIAVFSENIAVYPVANNKLTDAQGNILPDCHIVPKGTTALEFAYKIHSTIGDNFIRAINMRTNMALKKNETIDHRDVIQIVN